MPLKEFFKTRPKYVTIKPAKTGEEQQPEKKEIPDGLWVKCNSCGLIIYHKELAKNLYLCPRCDYHFRIGARERLNQILDKDSFTELFEDLRALDPLDFPNYITRLKRAERESGLPEAVVTGSGRIDEIPVGIGAMDPFFIMGSMGSVVGEKITLLIEYCLEHRLPLIIISVGGGARMQEGIFSLMQMAKTSAALARYARAGLLYLSVMTDPTTGGVFASFSTLGDIIITEPGALLGFTGQRVIEQTIRQTLPPGFQSSSFQLEHGFVDMIVNRRSLRKTLTSLLRMHGFHGGAA